MAAATKSSTFPAYTAEQLAEMTPDQLDQVLKSAQQQAQQLDRRAVELQTQQTHLDQQIEEAQAKLKAEFNITTLEELEALRTRELASLETLFANIAALDIDPAAVAA